MEEYSRRRNSEEGPGGHGNGGVEMEDVPLPTPPRRNLNPTFEDVEEEEGIDLEEDEGEFIMDNMRDSSPHRRHHQGPLEHAEFVDLDDDESEVLMDLRQEYNAIVDDLENFAMLQEQLPRFGQQDDATGNEAPPQALQNDGSDFGGADPLLLVRDDVEGGRNGDSSSSSSDDGSDNEEGGQAPPVRNSEDHGAISYEADPGPIQPRPELVLLPAHLIPAQIMRLIPVRSRRGETLSPMLAQDRTYAEYDRFQEMTSQHSSLPMPRRSARIAAFKSSATKSSTTLRPATRTPVTRTPVTRTPATPPPLFTPIDGAPISFESPSRHELTKTSSIWGTVIQRTISDPKASVTEPLQTRTTSKTILPQESLQDSSPSAAKLAPSAELGSSVVVPKVKVTASPDTSPKPSALRGPPAVSPNDVSRSHMTTDPGPLPKKGFWDSMLAKEKKSTTKDSLQPNEHTKASTAPTSRPGLGNSILGKKKNDTSVESSHPDQHTKAPPAPARKRGLGDNMLERKRHKTTTDSSNNIQTAKSPLTPTLRPELGNNTLEKKKPLSGQRISAPPPLPSSQQSTSRQTNVDNSIPCPNCTFRNAPFVSKCGACDASFTHVSSIARRGQLRAKKPANYNMSDDDDE
jgi:hypothetical protein